MYHATQHGRPTVNGLSGYAPPHYGGAQSAIRDEDTGVLEVVAAESSSGGVRARGSRRAPEFLSLLPRQSRARHVASTADARSVPADRGRARAGPDARFLEAADIADIQASVRAGQVDRLRDGNRRTAWIRDGPQRGTEALTIRLPSRQLVSGVVLAHGAVQRRASRGS